MFINTSDQVVILSKAYHPASSEQYVQQLLELIEQLVYKHNFNNKE